MTQDYPMIRAGAPAEYPLAPPLQPSEPPPPPNPLLVVWAALKGRLRYAIPLGIVLGSVGAFVAFKLAKPQYESTGLVRIKPYVEGIVDSDKVMPMFDAFIESQALLMHNRRTTMLALSMSDWRSLNLPQDPDAFEKIITVTRPKGSEVIVVTADHAEPDVAVAAVNALIAAYKQIYDENNTASTRLTALEQYRTKLTNDLNTILASIDSEARAAEGNKRPDQKFDWQNSEIEKLESERRQVKLQIVVAAVGRGQSPATANGPTSRPVDLSKLSDEVIARIDPQASKYAQQRTMLEGQVRDLQSRLGPNHSKVKEAENLLATATQALAGAIADYRQAIKEGVAQAAVHSAVPTGNPDQLSLEQLQAKEKALDEMIAGLQNEAKVWGTRGLRMDQLRADADKIRAQIDDTKAKIDRFNVESSITGRLQVISPGSRPTAPMKDKRIPFAAAGGVGGLAAGLGIFVLLGLLDRSFRSANDASGRLGHSMEMLGMLPYVPEDLADPEQAAVASHCVHHIRTLLQLRYANQGPCVLAITSPAAGDGKTSLTLALGLSFVAAGSKTLLVDCDIIGSGLTIKSNTIVRRKIGQVLLQDGLLTPEQLEEALEVASRSGRRLGEVIVHLGYLSQQVVEVALGKQNDSLMGLTDVLAGEPLANCIREAGVGGLWVLPIGSATARDATRISPMSLARVVEAARKEFDVILIDTGPILGSLEAAIAARAADQVILTVSRGEPRSLAEKAIAYLHSIGAPFTGMVFNRAHQSDVMARYSSSTRSLISSPPDPRRADPASVRLGPVASAVVDPDSRR